ncbi:HEPN domain-containing protein [Paenibacillus sp. Y5S-9]|uniref:HEPN domain-containing protein n=1 Tax=Paenibacillus sp. Y5S-9 TaxID=3122489 RepID=UPI0030D3B8F8
METITQQKGIFFRANRPHERIKGSFSFSQESGGVLEIEGCFPQSEEYQSDFFVIIGELRDGTLVTLMDCFLLSFNPFQLENSTSKYYSNLIIKGCHFNSKEEVKIDTLEVEYSNLNDWIMRHGFRFETNFDEKSIVINYILPKPIEVLKTEKYCLSLTFKATPPTQYIVQSEVSMVQKTAFLIESESLKLEEYLLLSHDIENFFTLSMITKQKLAFPTKMTGISNGKQIQLYFKLSSKDDREISSYDMLFTYPDVKDMFGQLILNWLEKGEIIKPVSSLFLELVQRPQLIPEKKFLNIINALEVFHRRTREGTEFPKEDHRKRLDSIYETLNGNEHLEWLKSKLHFSNEISLKKRIHQLLTGFPLIEEYLGEGKDIFVKKVVNTRNFYTHYDINSEKKALKRMDLHNVTQELKILTLACLLHEIGFDEETVNTQIIKYSRSIGIILKNEDNSLKELSDYLSDSPE